MSINFRKFLFAPYMRSQYTYICVCRSKKMVKMRVCVGRGYVHTLAPIIALFVDLFNFPLVHLCAYIFFISYKNLTSISQLVLRLLNFLYSYPRLSWAGSLPCRRGGSNLRSGACQNVKADACQSVNNYNVSY